jgi:hypothetical protein
VAEGVILPCLKEPSWGRDGLSVCRPLWRGDSPQIPWVSFGYDRPESFDFLSRAALADLKKSETEVEREAVRNLSLRKATWESVEVKLGFLKKLRMLGCGDNFLAAERILDPGFMREAQTRLKARGLLVGIPRRGYLVVTDGEGGVDRITPFATMVSMQYHRGESAPISPALFAVKDGSIVGMVDAGAEAGRSAAMDADEEQEEDVGGEEEDAGAPYITTLVVEDSPGVERIEICAGGEDFDRLSSGIVSALAGGLTRHGSRPAFGGEIRVVILGYTPTEVRKELPRLKAHLEGILAETRIGGRTLRVSIQERESSWPS